MTATEATAWHSLPKTLGLVGLIDPPRQEAIEAVKECHAGGIRVTMITGDHKITAAAIAKMLDIGDGKTAVTSAEVAEMDMATLEETVPKRQRPREGSVKVLGPIFQTASE